MTCSTMTEEDNMPQWHLIDGDNPAPRDGTRVIVMLDNGEVFRAKFDKIDDIELGWHVSNDIGFVNPKYWMPLPTPPTEK